MSDLGALLGGGRYAFFNSMRSSHNPEIREAYEIAAGRVGAASVALSGTGLNGQAQMEATPEMQQFNSMMRSYLGKLQSLAAQMRQNEINYISDLVAQFEKDENDVLLDSHEKDILRKMLTADRITMSDYTTLINALNKVKYADQKEEFSKTIKAQLTNLTVLKTNFDKLSAEDKKEVTEAYLHKYGKYAGQYGRMVNRATNIKMKINNVVVEKYAGIQTTTLDTMAKKINATLAHLANNEQFIAMIRAEYANHLEETEFTITKNEFLSSIIDSIIEEVRKNPRKHNDTIAKNIANKIMTSLSANKDLRSLGSNSQAYKITQKKKGGSDAEQLLKSLINGKGNAKVVDLLNNLENMEETVQSLLPDEAPQYINKLQELRKRMEAATDKMEQDALKKEKAEVGKKIREEFRNTDLGKELTAAISNNSKFDINSILINQQNEFLNRVRSTLSDLTVIVKKSSLAELMASNQAKAGIEKAISTQIGGSFNLKDDVIAAVRTGTITAPSQSEVSAELNAAISKIDDAISEVVDTYLETYYKREQGTEYEKEQTGTTNVKKAREDYEQVMKHLLDQVTDIYNSLDKKVQKELDAYAKQTHTFLESISVKEYSLYQDELGFHGGTLGPTAMKAVENIQAMYEKGGISKLDIGTLELALINCADTTVGGPGLRKSLESYLLGGAALMMFDEGFGEAVPYLEKMEDSVAQLMPQNLNLYQLNSAYIPASFIIESIYQNLNAFYHAEYENCVTDFIANNKVIINNPANSGMISHNEDITAAFAATSSTVLGSIDIQFVFMAGMLDIFSNLSAAFKVT